MAHLPSQPRRALAVEVNGRAGHAQPSLIVVDFIPDPIGHCDRAMTDRFAERSAGDGADMQKRQNCRWPPIAASALAVNRKNSPWSD
jgi:hypothetical protein